MINRTGVNHPAGSRSGQNPQDQLILLLLDRSLRALRGGVTLGITVVVDAHYTGQTCLYGAVAAQTAHQGNQLRLTLGQLTDLLR